MTYQPLMDYLMPKFSSFLNPNYLYTLVGDACGKMIIVIGNGYGSIVIFWPFDPAKNAIPRWCTGRRWHILMAVMRGNRVGRNWLMKWDELKNSHGTLIDWCTRREWPLNCMTVIFRLMMIKHSISKIEWASNDYLTQLSSTSQLSYRQFEFQSERDEMW